MITAGPVYPTAYINPGSAFPCGGGDAEGGCQAGPRFGPSSADGFGPGAWPFWFGYEHTPAVLLSVPGFDGRPASPYLYDPAIPINGPVVNGGYRGGPSYGYPVVSGGPGANPIYSTGSGTPARTARRVGFPGFPRWSESTTFAPQSQADPDLCEQSGAGDVLKGVLWLGAGLLAGALLRGRGRRGF